MWKPNRRQTTVLALATAIAIPAEGLRQYAYRDVASVITICYGTTSGVKLGDYRTLTECKALLNKDMLHAIELVESCQPNLPVNVLAAFSDAVYNLGPTIACDQTKSTAARHLAARSFAAACNQLPAWNKARVAGALVPLPGLTKRRNQERELCLAS